MKTTSIGLKTLTTEVKRGIKENCVFNIQR